jgi:2-methylisocitrate lyase-like PEP mutase family enzyme
MLIGQTIDTPLAFIVVVSLVLLLMGLVFEALSMVLIMTPVLLPAAMGMRFDPIWFGVYMVIMVECALITPPVGLNLYVIQSVAKASLTDVARGVLPFLALMFVTVVLLYSWPDLALYYPLQAVRLDMTAPDRGSAPSGRGPTPSLHVMPCCFDALSAKLIAQEGFGLTFMSGFAASASPHRRARSRADELCRGARSGAQHHRGGGHPADRRRRHRLWQRDERAPHGARLRARRRAAVMIEDQVAPKRCGHTPGKAVVSREEAFDRIRAAVDARADDDILILARTDARHEHGLSEAIARAERFAELGADILFVEAPEEASRGDARRLRRPARPEDGQHRRGRRDARPLPRRELREIGYAIAAYPLTLMAAAMQAMVATARRAGRGRAAATP